MSWISWIPLKRKRITLLAARYDKIAKAYEDMAELTKNMCPQPKPLSWSQYCKIQQVTYEMRAEEMRGLL